MTTRNILSGGDAPEPTPAPPATAPSGGSGSGDGWNGGSRLRVPPDPERDLVCCRLPLTDMGNAERWRVRFGRDFRYCPELGWLAWDSRRWKLLSEEKDQVPAAVTWSTACTVRAIRNEAALVAASGYPAVIGLSDRELRELQGWADAFGVAERERYVRDAARVQEAGNPHPDPLPEGEGEASIAAWLERLDPMDIVLGKKLWSQSIAAFAKASEKAGVVASMVKWIKGFPDIVVRPDQLDADRMAINVLNGTLRLVRGNEKRGAAEIEAGKSEWHAVWKIRKDKHDRADLLTKLAPVKYAPSAACPAYDGFVARVQPDEADRRFLHQWGGLSLTGDVSEQKLAFFYGAGRNGKGTWVEAVAHIAGDYAGSIPIESFLENGIKRRGDQATPDLARLPGVRFLRVSEPEKGSSLNEGLIKMVTGGDPVDARHLNKGFFTFLPSFKMTISGNHKPKVKDTSDGIWRRMQLLPWTVTIPAGEVDRQLPAKLEAERSGILNRLLDGLLDWKANGLIEPESVRNATQAYRDQSDDLGRFLAAICVVSGDKAHVRCPAKELHELYQAWAEAAGGATLHIKGFKTAMEAKGFEQKQSDGQKWLGVMPRPGVDLDSVKRGVWPSGAELGPSDAGDGGAGDDWLLDEPPAGFE